MDSLAQKAIDEALRGNWAEAKALNQKILKENPRDEEALNRLARACLELGDLKKTIFCYKKVLRLDPYNTIAQKAIFRLSKSKRKIRSTGPDSTGAGRRKLRSLPLPSAANLFIEEPGRTKTVPLIHLGADTVISELTTGEEVKLAPHAHRVSVQTKTRSYVGRIPDDLSRRLIKLTRAGNIYKSLVKSVSPDGVKIFIREVKREESLGNIPSFPSNEKPGHAPFGSDAETR
ncbi:MAG: tetratricopeptide repeat protein [Candidatus Blackburnbacteria bacterium]|nr:tetratricopeptide repeat protein [Candidatus Blackburnbacteria bacterium]